MSPYLCLHAWLPVACFWEWACWVLVISLHYKDLITNGLSRWCWKFKLRTMNLGSKSWGYESHQGLSHPWRNCHLIYEMFQALEALREEARGSCGHSTMPPAYWTKTNFSTLDLHQSFPVWTYPDPHTQWQKSCAFYQSFRFFLENVSFANPNPTCSWESSPMLLSAYVPLPPLYTSIPLGAPSRIR